MQSLEVSGAVRLIYRALGVKGLKTTCFGLYIGHHQVPNQHCQTDISPACTIPPQPPEITTPKFLYSL